MFQPGDQLVVLRSLQTISADAVRLTPGLKGQVVEVDHSGDLLVNLNSFERLQWVSSSDTKGFQKDAMPVEHGIRAEEEASGSTPDLQRLLAENNVALLRALQDMRSEVKNGAAQRAEDLRSELAGLFRETKEQIALQNERITGLAYSVDELRTSVGTQQQEQGTSCLQQGACRSPTLDEHKAQMSETLKIKDSGGLLLRETVQIDFSPVIQAIREHALKIDALPLMQDIRVDMLALLQGVRESNELTVDSAAKALKETHTVRLSELFNSLEASRRRDDEEAFLAMLQALQESKAEMVGCMRGSRAEMQARGGEVATAAEVAAV